jgi:hypothetical protein
MVCFFAAIMLLDVLFVVVGMICLVWFVVLVVVVVLSFEYVVKVLCVVNFGVVWRLEVCC